MLNYSASSYDLHNTPRARSLALFLCTLWLLTSASLLHAWDSTGHRAAAAITFHNLSVEQREMLIDILVQHPRFEADFRSAMPSGIDSETGRQRWLFGQAAYWPDLARGLPENERVKYNRPAWHYTDGAWLRGEASVQGNSYVGVDVFASISGEEGASIETERQVHNISTAIDFNAALFRAESTSPAQRAVALCWLLHLMADIHQPLHTGSLFSATLFETGDRGGNRIPTNDGNLHYRWDAALSANSTRENERSLLQRIDREDTSLRRQSALETGLWDLWLLESRQLLAQHVYTPELKNAIGRAERNGARLAETELSSSYVANMQDIAERQLALAGLRIANWIREALGN